MVVVVRYFGGTKLGVSGLINAYKTAAADALEKSDIGQITITKPITLIFPYDQTNEVMKIVADFDIKIDSQDFTENCSIRGSILPSLTDSFEKKAKLIYGLEYNLS